MTFHRLLTGCAMGCVPPIRRPWGHTCHEKERVLSGEERVLVERGDSFAEHRTGGVSSFAGITGAACGSLECVSRWNLRSAGFCISKVDKKPYSEWVASFQMHGDFA